jgi:hypothetical protein
MLIAHRRRLRSKRRYQNQLKGRAVPTRVGVNRMEPSLDFCIAIGYNPCRKKLVITN